MKLALSLVVILGLAVISQAAIVQTVGTVSVDVTADTITPASAGLTAFIVTISSPVGIYAVDGRIDATTGYLNQSTAYGMLTPVADPAGLWNLLTPQQKADDTNVMVLPGNQLVKRAPLENCAAGTSHGTFLAGSADGLQTMAFGFQDATGAPMNYYNIALARVVLATGSVAEFKFNITDNNKDNDAFDFSFPLPGPEPMTLSLLAAGSLALIRRRR